MSNEGPHRDNNLHTTNATHSTYGLSTQDIIQTPKRDKFASLAARQMEQSAPNERGPIQPSSSTGSTEIPKPPRRDKFASLSARQRASSADGTILTSAGHPSMAGIDMGGGKIDTFMSMSRAADVMESDEARITSGTTPNLKRDKFSSLKLKMSNSHSSVDAKGTTLGKQHQMEARTKQRLQVLRDLDKAEGYTWNLIQLASKTAAHLTKLQLELSDNTLADLSVQFRDVLQKINSLLSPHSIFIKAYENHPESMEATNVYAARVETRLAQERRNVFEELLAIEQQEMQQHEDVLEKKTNENKRKRESLSEM